ncbi:MAG TPA: response regulator [Candidatus Margulisiibacteriota bacterium]|nr:response regulator [Candidatus Margulisiibacteriota bacterium]
MARILIVDDDDNQRLLYRELFEEEGYEVVDASDGRQALVCIERDPPDAVILDINMPGMDGLQTLARIHDLNRRLPVILHSAYAAYQDQFVSWIADAYVTKSSDPEALTQAVRAVLAKKPAEG